MFSDGLLAPLIRGMEGEADSGVALGEFLAAYSASIVILSGEAKGIEFALDQVRVTLGRGPGVDLCLDDPEMSREHASIEFAGGRFVICSLGEERALLVNGGETRRAELKSEDRFRVGGHSFQFLVEERRHLPPLR